MKYYVVTDAQGYVQMIKHTGTKMDFVELDLSAYDLTEDRIHAYKLGKNELIFDDLKYEDILREKQKVADDKEIAELEQKLNDTDWIIARWGEEIVSLTNPVTWVADVIKINTKYAKEYKETFALRKTWRARIEELSK